MSLPMSANETLTREYFGIRAKLLELAASFDRIERAEGDVSHDKRLAQFQESLRILSEESGDRAEQLQLLFSRDYDAHWRRKFELPAPR